MEVLQRIAEEKIVPVIKLQEAKNAVPLADALSAGNIGVAEVTFRTDAAAEAIGLLRKERKNMLVGAGTVLTLDQLDAAVAAGAQFIVAPGFNPVIVEACIKKGVPITPGVNNPSQVEVAMQMGLEVLKFFPAELSGGVPMLKTLGSVYAAKFMPTGGLNVNNVLSYLNLANVIACGGSWMVKPDFIQNGDYETIQKLSAAVKELVGA